MILGPLLPKLASGMPVKSFTHLLQMNLLMRKKNIRTLRMRWTRRSQNCQDSKCGKLVGANTVLGRAYVSVGVWAGWCTPSPPAARSRLCGLTWLTADAPHITTTTTNNAWPSTLSSAVYKAKPQRNRASIKPTPYLEGKLGYIEAPYSPSRSPSIMPTTYVVASVIEALRVVGFWPRLLLCYSM